MADNEAEEPGERPRPVKRTQAAETPMPRKARAPKLDRMVGLEVPIAVVLAEKSFSLEEILDLRPGAILHFAKRHDQPLDLIVNGSRVGRGRAVDIGERLGFLLEEVEPAAGRASVASG
jgi:flagellar motor switch/type III secretory pathway protein FliN